jgi:ATP-dependent RNA helicase RhlB
MSNQLLTDVAFASLDLAPELQRGLADAGFVYCTPIQAESLPKALAGTDVAGQAQTGTGKTAAFLLAAMNRLLRTKPLDGTKPGDPRVLILAPTRELAIQIHKDAQSLGCHTPLRLGLVYGGAYYDRQREMLSAGVDILIGTPGRLIDYCKQNLFTLKGIQVAVLDEADRMFDLGFIKDIRFLLRRMPRPEYRLNLLFSATLSLRVMELAYEHMNNPTVVNVSPEQVTVEGVKQTIYHVPKAEKIPLLIGLLRRREATRTIVFTNTKRAAERVAEYLNGNGLQAGLLSGDVPQGKRIQLLERFTRGALPILVATDVAARGLHIPDVSHVINFDLPQDAEDYVHRIGRTARAGASGDAISFACEEYVYSLLDIEQYIGSPIPRENVTDALLPEVAPVIAAGKKMSGAVRRQKGKAQSSTPRTGGRSARVSPRQASGSQVIARKGRPPAKARDRSTESNPEG